MSKVNIWEPYELKIVSSNGELDLNSQGLDGLGSAYHVIGSTGLSGIPVINRFRDGLVAGGVHVNQRLGNREVLLKIALNAVYDPNNPDDTYIETKTEQVYIGDAQEVDSGGNAVYDEDGNPVYTPVYSDIVSSDMVNVSYHRKKLDDLWNNVTHIIMGDSLKLLCTYANGEVWELELVYESGLEGNFSSSKLYQFSNRHFAYIDLAFQSTNPYWWAETETVTLEADGSSASIFLHPLQSLQTTSTNVFTNNYKITNSSFISSPITWSLRGTMASGSTFGIGDDLITLNIDLNLEDVLTITPRWNQSPIIQLNGEDRLDAVIYPISVPELANGDNILNLNIQGDTPTVPVLTSNPAYYNYALNPSLLHEEQIITTNTPCEYSSQNSSLSNTTDELVIFSYVMLELRDISKNLQINFNNSVDSISPEAVSDELGIAWGACTASAVGTFQLQGYATASGNLSNSMPLYISMIGDNATQQYIDSFSALASAVREGGYYIFTSDIYLTNSELSSITITKDTYFNLNSHTLYLKEEFNFILSTGVNLFIVEGNIKCQTSFIQYAPTLTLLGDGNVLLYDIPECDAFHIKMTADNTAVFIYNTKFNLYSDNTPPTITETNLFAHNNGVVFASYNGETVFTPPILNTSFMKCIIYGAVESQGNWGNPEGITQKMLEYGVSDTINVDKTLNGDTVSKITITHNSD